MRFGDYECETVELDRFWLDGGAMFGVVPKVLWESKIPGDDRNRIPMTARCLVIRGNDRVILVDAGIGDKMTEKMRRIYDVAETGPVSERLAGIGISPEDVTDVVISHLHFDHTGGATTCENGNVVPTFPGAMYHVQKEQWELAVNPSPRDRGSYITDNFLPLQAHGSLNLINGPVDDLFEGIDLLVSGGHTSGQHHLLVRDPAGPLFFCSDMIPTSAHIPIAWHMAYDNEPLVLLQEKSRLLSRAARENWVLCFAHDPQIAAARVREDGGRGVVFDEAVEL